MNQALLSLAFALQSNKGVFALLLGSGISRAAGIPTGWEVVIDLVRKLARMQDADCEPDPAAWYRATFGVDADYSRLLDAIAHTPAERQQLLKSYFEPNEEERAHGLKMPTAAHHAIARLVASGHIHVIVTTNFDRLLEKALEATGIQPVVISTADAVDGAVPLTHLSCVIIKPNGDYLDSRIKNTESELASYPPATRRLLRQVFDEYGLILCGWSGDWDSALRSLIERCSNRRFTTYWAARGDLSESAQRLAGSRRAETIQIADADRFFAELEEKVRSLDDIGASHPISARVAAATVKRYVVDPQARIRLHDLFVRETNEAVAALNEQAFPHNTQPTLEDVNRRCRRFEVVMDVLLSAIPVTIFWGEPIHVEWTVKTIERIGNTNGQRTGSGTFFPEWQRLHRYPALLLIFAAGVTALAANKLAVLHQILSRPICQRDNYSDAMIFNVPAQTVKYLPDKQTGQLSGRHYEFIGYTLHRVLRPHLHDILPDEAEYVSVIHRFEYLLGLVISDLSKGDRFWPAWFARNAYYMPHPPTKMIEEEIAQQGDGMPLLKAGFFGQSLDRLITAKAKLDEHLAKLGW